MNSYLQKALEDLYNSGGQGIPNESTIEDAKDGTTWSGMKNDGSSWTLTKNSNTSFTVSC
jgi:hypothetical protein